MERYICIHGHFYQPPRENPWLEIVEIQDSAHPYHDWNERITAECYGPNSSSRLLDGKGSIIDIVNNYEKISFNFGPTLLLWMEKHSPEAYSAIISADSKSAEARSGHGNAISQVYNHVIMPLANSRDKRTQVRWGIADFEHRFGRFPEGMWLAETAVDIETLDILAEHGIKFTILAPNQAEKVRKKEGGEWEDVKGSVVDPTRPYECNLPSGRQITIFFYDGPISRAVAFEKLLDRGETFAGRILTGFSENRSWDQIVNIATDGESYGHHHKFGDMALAYATHHIEEEGLATLTNYAEFLEKRPPEAEVRIFENTSWSCAHGIERWRKNCGCNSGGHPGWNQEWRAPLRDALDWLRDRLSPLFEGGAADYLSEPWTARDAYIDIILDRSETGIEAFLKKHALRDLNAAEKVRVLQMLEMQRHAMLMYTSCGWFFDELSGIETLQVLDYAGRAIQLGQKLFSVDLETPFKETLSKAKSNIAHHQDGARIYEKIVKPAIVDLKKVAAHFAISSFISEYGPTSKIYSYTITRDDYEGMQSGEAKLGVGKITITSDITLDSGTFVFSALHLGGHIFNAGLTSYEEDSYRAVKEEILTIFKKGDIAEMIRHMDQQFGMRTYSLVDMFRDEQRKILNLAISKTMEDFEHSYRVLYEENRTLMTFLQETGMPVPKVFATAAEFTLISDIKRAFSSDGIDRDRIRGAISDAEKWDARLDAEELEYLAEQKGEDLIRTLRRAPYDYSALTDFLTAVEFLRTLPFEINYWQMQNTYYNIAKKVYRDFLENANKGSESAAKWVEAFRRTGELLGFNVASVLGEDKEVAAA